MNSRNEIKYALDFVLEPRRNKKRLLGPEPAKSAKTAAVPPAIPRVAKLMALAIRFEALVTAGTVRNYAELARSGYVSRGRITQILRLLHLAPDVQEQLLFSQPAKHLNERDLRHIVQ